MEKAIKAYPNPSRNEVAVRAHYLCRKAGWIRGHFRDFLRQAEADLKAIGQAVAEESTASYREVRGWRHSG